MRCSERTVFLLARRTIWEGHSHSSGWSRDVLLENESGERGVSRLELEKHMIITSNSKVGFNAYDEGNTRYLAETILLTASF